MTQTVEHQANHYHSLLIELQEAKRSGHIFSISLLEHDILVLMATSVPDSKVSEVSEHISKKYGVFTKTNLTTKTITIHDAYTLDPRV